MRKPVLFALFVAIVALLGATVVLYQKLQKSSSNYATLQADEQATRDRYGQAIDEIAAIQDSLNVIALGDDGVQVLATQLDAEQRLSQSRGDEAMARISIIKAGIERTKDKIQDLDAKLQKSGVKIAGLDRMIQNLRKSVAEKEALVAQLTQRVGALETQVTGLVADVQENKQTIQAQAVTIEDSRRELGTIYYTIGSRKDLLTAGLIVAKGGVLGLGRTLKLTGQIDENKFTALDTDQQTVIYIPSAKANVLSDQPPASYELQLVGGQLELHILDPKTFRTVKHVVIMTA